MFKLTAHDELGNGLDGAGVFGEYDGVVFWTLREAQAARLEVSEDIAALTEQPDYADWRGVTVGVSEVSTAVKAEVVTDEQLKQLKREAGEASDLEQVALCDAALGGVVHARAACADAIADARAQWDEE